MFKIIYISFVLIFTPKLCQGQTGCHSLFGFHQSDTILTVNFTDSTISSTPITSWLWDFGDGHSSTSHNPHHTYDHAGTYEVCLTVHNNHGCNSTYCHAVTVSTIQPECHALFGFQQSDTTLTVNFADCCIVISLMMVGIRISSRVSLSTIDHGYSSRFDTVYLG